MGAGPRPAAGPGAPRGGPRPRRPWAQGQTWDDLLFLHWPVEPSLLEPFLPAGLEPDTRDGAAWLGVVPFTISSLRLRGLPALPPVGRFHELNVRTYVTVNGRPGVWFLSLDATSRAAVEAARRLWRLPYVHARIAVSREGEWVRYRCERGGRGFAAAYRGAGDPVDAAPGSLEWFLVERYCLYAARGERLYRGEIHHRLWQLQRAEAHVERNTIAPLPLPAVEPHALYAERQDTVVWPLERVR
jgi:uncharacterized protein YqjF (DUF2071 family)